MNRSATILVVLFIWILFTLNGHQTLVSNINTPCSTDEPKMAASSKEIISSSKRKNTMIISTRPASYLRLQAIWSQLECFTSNVDRIILSVPDEEWCHRTMNNFTSQVKSNLGSSIHDKITVQYYKNDRYDSGLWCDALEEENAGVFDDTHNYFLINDSILAIRQYTGLLDALFEDGVSFVSLNYWLQVQEGEQPYWLESAARAFTSRGIKKYREGVCQNLAEEVGSKCSKIRNPTNKKRCIVDYTEISVASFYNSSETRGLYPGEVHASMVKGTRSWSGNIPVSLFCCFLFILMCS